MPEDFPPLEQQDRLEEAVNPDMTEFFTTLDDIYRSDEQGPNFEIVSEEVRKKAHLFASTIERLYEQDPHMTVEQLIDHLQNAGVEMKPGGENHGYYHVLSRTNIAPEWQGPRNGNFFVLAVLPKGHTAPAHIHRDSKGRAGEVTVSLRGNLQYVQEDGSIDRHFRDRLPRISPPDSLDAYIAQEVDWVGFYFQPESCDISEKNVDVAEKLMERFRRGVEFLSNALE